MGNASVQIKATCLDGKPLEVLNKLIESRIKHTQELSKDSVIACVINILTSIRASTKLAKVEKDIQLKCDNSLMVSFKSLGKGKDAKKEKCIRSRGSRHEYHLGENERIRWTKDDIIMKVSKVYRWTPMFNNKLSYLIVANSDKSALNKVKEIIQARINKTGGLAKKALGVLMYKSAKKSSAEGKVGTKVNSLANENTKVTTNENNSGGDTKFSITVDDLLNYSMLALKNKQADFDDALKKASNKIYSILLKNCPGNYFTNEFKSTPFPEVMSRKK